mgnify:CR=1 FL=1
MPRRREVPKRDILPDPKFGSQDVAKFVNVLMMSGKKSVAEGTLYRAFDQIKSCLLYTSDAADERSSVDLGGRRIIKKKKRG